MRRFVTRLIAGGMLLACFAVAAPQSADAQVVIGSRGSARAWDRSGYWDNYWRWYDGRYRPYYGQSYHQGYYSQPGYYGGSGAYGRQSYYGRGWGQPGYGMRGGARGGVQVGGVRVFWR